MIRHKGRNREPADELRDGKIRSGKSLDAVRFEWLESVACDGAALGLQARIAILLVCRYCTMPDSRKRFERTNIPTAWPSHERLADALGCSKQAVSAAMKNLTKHGFIAVLRKGGGRGIGTEYGLVEKGNRADCPFPDQKGQRRKSEGATPANENGKSLRQKRQRAVAPSPSIHTPRDIPSHHSHRMNGNFLARVKGKVRERHDDDRPEFEELFRSWPNGNNDREAAFGAWVKYVEKKGVDPARVLRSGRNWIGFWDAMNTNRPPYFGIWLRDELWREGP